MELDGKTHSPIINDDEASQQHHVHGSPISHQPPDPHHDLCERIWEGAITDAEADELSWLQRDEEYNFDFLEGISLISVGSNDFPVPEFTLQAIAQKWHDKIEHDEKWLKYDDNKHKSGGKLANGECNEQKVDEQAITADKEKSPVIVDSNSELNESKEISPVPSTDSCDNLTQPKRANLTFTKLDSSAKELSNQPNNVNSTFTYSNKDSDISGGTTSDEAFDIPKSNIPQLQIPSTKNNSSEMMACGEVTVIRECCNKTIEIELSSSVSTQSITHGGATDKSTKVTVQPGAPVIKKKAPVASSNSKPVFPARKLPVKNNATVVKVPTISNNTLQSNQSHLPKQEAKLKQNIKKSLLSKPIIVSKTTTRTENARSMGPCKPAALNRPVNKVNTKSHPVKLVTVPHHSTPIKDQTAYRRKSVAMTPPRDSSETADKVVKQKRRSGIPLLGGMTQDVKVPMGPCNKSAEHEPNGALGMSPVVGKRKFQLVKSTQQYGIPKPKTQLNFNTSFDPLEGMDLDGLPPGGSKLVHSPAEKENDRNTVHSQWSPIKRNKGITADEECIRCTKHTAKHF